MSSTASPSSSASASDAGTPTTSATDSSQVYPTQAPVGGNAGGVFGTNNLYQSVIIALVAGGVFSLAFLSVVVRRRRFREMQAAIRDRQARLDAYALLPRPSTSGPDRDVGRQPAFWDVLVGGHVEKSEGGRGVEGDGESEDSKSLKLKEKEAIDEDEEDGEVDVEGQMRTGWIPTSLSLSHNSLLSSDHAGRIAAEITVLISMPSPSSSSSPTASPRAASKRLSAPIFEAPLDEETIPPVQLASTNVTISSLNLAKRRELDRWMRDAEKRRTRTGTHGGGGTARIERVDGFRDPG